MKKTGKTGVKAPLFFVAFLEKEQFLTRKEDTMRNGPYESEGAPRHFAYPKVDVIKLNTKCLFAGHLERVKDWEEKPHSHDFCEIMLVLAGEGEVRVNGISYGIRKGDVVVYNRGAEHGEKTEDEGLALAFFGIRDFNIERLPADHLIAEGCSPVLHTGEDEDKFVFWFSSLVAEVASAEPYGELMAKYLARLILIGILRITDLSESTFVTNAAFACIYRYLNKNFATIDSMESVCEELHISKYYLSHVFKKHTGTSPLQYVTERRIAYAKQLLAETTLSAGEVGEACGYRDRAVFFKAFKRAAGITPGEYRKQYKAGGKG